MFSPHRVNQEVRRKLALWVEQQHGEHELLPVSAELQSPVPLSHRQRPENPEVHAPRLRRIS